MPSQQMQRFSGLIRERRAGAPPPIEERRRQMEAGQARLKIPGDVHSEDVKLGGRAARWVRLADSEESQAVLYLHGGGYVQGSLNTHHELTTRVARASGAPTVGLDYRLAPEHPHPAALDDAVAAFDDLLALGFEPGAIALAGDSAGGGLALATLLRLRATARPLPGAAVLISPWTDLTGSGESVVTRRDADPMVRAAGLADSARLYAGDYDLHDPMLSPAKGDLSGLCPLLIHVGDHEVLLSDSLTVAKAVEAAGGVAELRVWDGAFHVFHSLPQLPESEEALTDIGEFLRNHLVKPEPDPDPEKVD